MTRGSGEDARLLTEDVGDGVRVLTMHRPDSLNAFDADQYEAVTGALRAAEVDDTVTAVVVTGEGRAFSAGADVRVLAGETTEPDRITQAFVDYVGCLAEFGKPLLAAVNGVAVGIGMTMLLHCDLVVLADDARLRAPFAALGVSPEGASSVLLPAAVGWQQAARILLTGDWVDADEAVALGLALTAVPGARVVDETVELARRIATGDGRSLAATKRLLVEGRRRLLGDTVRREVDVLADLVAARLAESSER